MGSEFTEKPIDSLDNTIWKERKYSSANQPIISTNLPNILLCPPC